MINDRLRFGIFLAPFHALNENPTNALDRDFELIEHLDKLGYDEAWIGEHLLVVSRLSLHPKYLWLPLLNALKILE